MDALDARARDFALGSLAAAYPDDELAETFALFGPVLREHPGLGPLVAEHERAGVSALASRFIDLFDQGKQRVSLYETEYGRMRGMSKGRDLADLSGFYRAFGLVLDDEAHEMLDHVAIELEFYAMLLAKEAHLGRAKDAEGVAIVADARTKFLTDHLGTFVDALAVQLPETEPYGHAFRWIAGLVAEECRESGARPTPLDPLEDEEGRKELRCGALPVLEG